MHFEMTHANNTLNHTPFFDNHVLAGAKLVDFAGWALPIHYGSLVDEHHAVRSDAGMFDVSHMTVMDITGDESTRAMYGCLCQPDGGVVDDVIVYRLSASHHRVISNAATRSKVLSWLQTTHEITELQCIASDALSMLAVQGPLAAKRLAALESDLFSQSVDIASMPAFSCQKLANAFIGRTGYTGEDGFEIIVPAADANRCWQLLVDAGIKPCGLGARDTLRLEAGMSLYGQDLDEEHSPFESGVGWTVDFSDAQRDFVGRTVLAQQHADGAGYCRIGLELSGRGVLRAEQVVCVGDRAVGKVTSGTFSPTLQRTIALARIERTAATSEPLSVLIRNKPVAAYRVPVPFYKRNET